MSTGEVMFYSFTHIMFSRVHRLPSSAWLSPGSYDLLTGNQMKQNVEHCSSLFIFSNAEMFRT